MSLCQHGVSPIYACDECAAEVFKRVFSIHPQSEVYLQRAVEQANQARTKNNAIKTALFRGDFYNAEGECATHRRHHFKAAIFFLAACAHLKDDAEARYLREWAL